MTRDEEKSVVMRVQDGDTAAFEQLVLDNQTRVYNHALRMLGGNIEDAYDISQEVFLRAFKSISSFRCESKFSVWLYRLTSNISIDFLRKKKRQEADSLTYDFGDGGNEELEITDERFSPETALIRSETKRAIFDALNKLAPEYREILVLREIEGANYDEIGQILCLELGTVKSRLFRARKKLCLMLEDYGNISGHPASDEVRGGI